FLVVRHEQRRRTAAVVVTHRNAHAARWGAAVIPSHARWQADLFEVESARSALVVVKKIVSSIVGDVNVRFPVPVHIDNDYTQAFVNIGPSPETRFLANVRK